MINNRDIKTLIAFNVELNTLVEGKLADDTKAQNSFSLFMSFVSAKAFKTHEAILLLCRHGYGEDAFMLARTLFELGVMSSYILQDSSEKRLMRYMEHDWVTRKEMYDYVRSKDELLCQLNKQIEAQELNQNVLEEVEREYKRVVAEYGFKPKTGWSNKSIAQMAEAIGRKDMYATVYRLQCMVSHTNARSMNEYVKEDPEGGVIINIGPNEDLTEKTLVVAFDLFRMIIEDADTILKWDQKDVLESIYKRYVEEVGNLNIKNKIKN
ncbi:MAG: DUF5677 domain-containing protein [bacterium]|nr:DUF5677 domain-containing protein [bacterium]